jgi:hypothetical protein
MPITSRSVTRAAALPLVALAISACSESLGPLDVSPEEFEAIGQAVALQIEMGSSQLTANEAMGHMGAPQFSVQSRRAGRVGGAAFLAKRYSGAPIRAQAVSTECGVPSQDPPTDSDGDHVPDNLVITFALPACHFADATGSFDLTGALRVWDPVPGTAAAAFNLGVDNFRVTFSSQDVSGFVRRDGLTSVVAAASGLSQTVSWLESARIDGIPAIGADIDWTATFAVAQGQSIVAGQPLPDGAYSPNGTFDYRVGARQASFSVTTVSPLQYDAGCAAGVSDGSALTPFASGTIRIAYRTENRSGAVDVTYSDCFGANVQYVSN